MEHKSVDFRIEEIPMTRSRSTYSCFEGLAYIVEILLGEGSVAVTTFLATFAVYEKSDRNGAVAGGADFMSP